MNSHHLFVDGSPRQNPDKGRIRGKKGKNKRVRATGSVGEKIHVRVADNSWCYAFRA
jgi:hypothetical protein